MSLYPHTCIVGILSLTLLKTLAMAERFLKFTLHSTHSIWDALVQRVAQLFLWMWMKKARCAMTQLFSRKERKFSPPLPT